MTDEAINTRAILDNKIVEWQRLKQHIAVNVAPLVTQEMGLRKELMSMAFPVAVEGTNNFDLGQGYTLKGVKKLEYKLDNHVDRGYPTDVAYDAIVALGNEGAFLAERLIVYKPELSVAEYKKLDPNNPTHIKIKALIDGVLTIKDASPTLEVATPKA